jgi:Uma2 family endonuclease
MLSDASAPWAEPVAATEAGATAEDLIARADDTWRFELVQGRLVRMPPTGYEHGNVALNLLRAVDGFVEANGLGSVSPPETGFLLSRRGEPDTVLAPDLAFVSAARTPVRGSPDWKGFPRLAPDLVVEIASPSQGQLELAAKARLWLSAGVRLVWIVWPVIHQIDVWQPGADEPAYALEETDQLEGGDVLPGFTCPVARLFR